MGTILARRATREPREDTRKAGRVAASVLVSAVGVAAAVLATSTPASAIDWDWGPWYSADASPRGAKAYFEEHGDRIKICDISTDGYRAHIWIYNKTRGHFQVDLTDTYNNGKCTYAGAGNGGYFNLPENNWYQMTVSIYKGGDTKGSRTFEIYNDH